MAIAAKSLTIGLIAGLLLALFVQQLVPSSQYLPSKLQNQAGAGSTPNQDFSFDTVPDMLRNNLQIAAGALRSAVAQYQGKYKSSVAAAHSVLQSTSHASTSPTFTRAFSQAPTMASSKPFLQAVKERRTIYQLNKEAPISDDKIVDLAKQAVLHVPSSFNSQSARLVVLLNAEHDKFWDFVKDVLKPMVPEEQWSSTEQRVAGFRGAYGTILFFEDPEPVHALEKAFPIYAHHFPTWSEHTSAMHQYALWVALEAEGFGANLQHYNPIIDRKAQEEWNIPLEWALRAQLVFGGRAGEPGNKEFKPVEGERLFVHGAKK